MKQRLIYITIQLSLLLLFNSCDDLLSADPKDKVKEENFWKSEVEIFNFLADIYATTFPVVYESSVFFDEPLSDNAYMLWDGWYTDVKLVANGTQDAYGSFPYNIWKKYYANIRKCYKLYQNIENVVDITEEAKNRYINETRFLEAYNYHRLVSFFGDVPLVTKVLTIEESKNIGRTSRQEIVRHIELLLQKASTFFEPQDMSRGRASWGSCKALLCRMYLNDNQFNMLLPIAEELSSYYHLHQEGETPYEDLFSGVAKNSQEIIFQIERMKSQGNTKTGHYGNQIFLLKGMSGGDALLASTPSGSLVDAYPMANGRLIEENGSAYNPSHPYKDRDPRFYQTIVYPTAQIKYLSGMEIKKTLYDPEDASTIIPEQLYNAKEPSPTGYMWNKYVDWSLNSMIEITDCKNDIIIMRYADILLMKAESLVELYGEASKTQIVDLIDQLRVRCGGGLVQRENYGSQEELRKLVRNERRIELANEGLRYFDVLRWRIGDKMPINDREGMAGAFYGAYMRLDGIGSGDRTVMVDGVPRRYVETRFFNPLKHYLQPIPQKERDLNKVLSQNPNW